ncbi:alpha-2-macroglobulin family protein [Mesorhizobium sp. B1-1-8]|uniref:alpha-2-macroglobulin family protein n=1 Tax=Mesorhizobium sp. B1-1-8 TaxID=2589976 RepID=UPI0011281166|nr:alpha-2-macroglobulin family protein [Mesorhizobium sp. B1-1-8]UCI09802.1 alpha-2-macroglobulin family protein [Mesorhizobium sp. B1-1-8]
MAMRAARGLSFFVLLFFALGGAALAAEARRIVTTDNSDYFGFDLRSEQNASLDQCKTTCLGDPACRAFTYNTKAKWCFLKSDYNQLKPFSGAVAGKIANVDGDPDIGAPPALAFFPNWMADQAQQFRNKLTDPAYDKPTEGLAALQAAAEQAALTGDHRLAMQKYQAAVSVLPDDGALWLALARQTLAVQPAANTSEPSTLPANVTSAAFNAYKLVRTAKTRAEALALLAAGLDKRDLFRPSLQAYEASLALVSSPAVQADYADLKARKGFRVVDHSVDADSSSPRICAQFSEELVKTGVDYSQFVTVDSAPPKGVEAKDKQICVEGLEHGQHYDVTFRAGLPAAVGETIAAPVVLSIYVQDRAPSARFTGDSFVLPSGARRGIPVVTVNMTAARMKLYRIGDRSLAQLLSGYQFLHQLDSYDISTISDQMGSPVWEGTLDIANDLNKEVTTSFPVDEAIPQRKPGVYVLTAQAVNAKEDDYGSLATQWFVVSDIGLSTYTGQDGLNVFARSLGSAKPIGGAEVTLLAKNNEILGTATTDAAGHAVFNPGLTRGEGGMVPAVLMAKQSDNDFVFLDMGRAGFDLSDRGVEGRAAPGALDVYAWTERGIYRAGEDVHVAALARDGAAKAVENLPLTFIFTRPDGVENRRIVSDGASAGGHAVDLPLEPNAMRGTWTVSIYTDPKQAAVASQMFLVEDFVPDRIEFDLTADKKEIAQGETANVNVDGRFLYGAPAAGLALEGEMTLSTTSTWDRFKDFTFGLADEQSAEPTVTPFTNLPVVGDNGKATFPVSIDKLPSTTKLVNAKVTVRMRETGGRAVERSLDIAVHPEKDMIGIRPDFEDGEVPQGGTAKFSIIAVDPNGKREELKGAQWSLVKVERNYQWYRSNNSWNYEAVNLTKAVANGQINLKADGEATVSLPVDWGRYRLEVETADPDGPATSYEFDAGWYVSSTTTETPDALEIALDKDSYAAGEVARLKISPHFAGELLVTIGADKLLKTVTATVPAGGSTVDIPVGDDWGAGAYVTATLFRPGDAQETRMPARAIGIEWLKVDPGSKKLTVALTPPEKTVPRQQLSIPVSVAGAQAGSNAYVMVAAVDVGILNLTNYKAPDPEDWFFGQRMLGLEIRDIYGRLIDGSLGTAGKLRTGGDGANMQSQGSPPTEKLVAFFSGPVELDANGKARIDFDIPQFNGTVRVMAVAWTKEAVGHAQTDVIVRDPVVITAGLPRFLAPNDAATMRLDIADTDGPAGDYKLSVTTTGDLSTGDKPLPQTLTLAQGKRQTLSFPLIAHTAGDASITVKLAHADGTTVEQTLYMPVRPAQLPVTNRMVVDLKPHGGSLRVDKELLAASVLDGASVSVGVSQSSALDVPSLLMTLDRYPYGCAEQTTSRAMPLLYVNDMAKSIGMESDPDLHQRVQDAIYKVLSYQAASGSFGLWGPGSGDLWLDAYVTEFLTRAREQKYDVPALAMNQALNNLQNSLGYDQDVQDRGSEIAYALYVLARNKKASIGDLRYYADTRLEAFSSPMAVAQLAASLALYGDTQRSEATFQTALRLAQSSTEYDYYRSDYGSPLRDGAAMLALAAESKPVPSIMPQLIKLVGRERADARWTSTQDESWMLLAARALKEGNDSITLSVNGAPHSGGYSDQVAGSNLVDSPLTIANTGTTPLQAVVTTVASPVEPLPAGGDGFTIDRTYYRLDGTEANVTEVKQNERYVVVLKIYEQNKWPSRLLITDLLPAGFEIDNPGLVSSAQLSNFSWLAQTDAAHLEFRDDRFVAAFNPNEGDSNRNIMLAYVVRAVTPGTYAHPPATVEDMYRPAYSARTASGVMEIKAP